MELFLFKNNKKLINDLLIFMHLKIVLLYHDRKNTHPSC